MSDFFKITARKKEGRRLTIYVETTHPDVAWFAVKKNVALQMLWDALIFSENDDAPLGQALTFEQVSNAQFNTSNEDRFIASVRALEANKQPAEADLFFVDADPDTGAPPEALLEIEATDTRWIAHITESMVWTSAAYDMDSYL